MSNPLKFVKRTWQVVATACSPLRQESAPVLSLTALEDRILYDASPLAGLVTDADKSINAIEDIDGLIHEFFVDDTAGHDVSSDSQLAADDMSDQQSFEPTRQLLVIDESIDDIEALFTDILQNSHSQTTFDIVRINDDSSGIEQISEALSSGAKYDAVHIVSHGSEASLQLGSLELNRDNIGDHTTELSGWASALTVDADILLYGCDVAGSVDGEFFVDQLSSITGADVAASDNLTGNAGLGGDWLLEYTTGDVQTEVAIGYVAQSDWNHTLATITVTTTVDENDGNTSSVTALRSDSGGSGISLREAIAAANSTAGDDVIVLEGETYELSLGGSLDTFTNVEIRGVSDGLTIIDGLNNGDRVFDHEGQTLMLSRLTVTGGAANDGDGGGGILVRGGATAVLDQVIVDGNTGTSGGGLRSSGDLTVTNSTFSNNTGFLSSGGIHLSGSSSSFRFGHNQRQHFCCWRWSVCHAWLK